MAVLRPFRALRPRPERVSQVASVPYDVVDRREAVALAANNPWSFLHVVRPEIDLPGDTDPSAPEVYAGGAAALERLTAAGVLTDDAEAALYVYRLTWRGRAQAGVVGCCSVADYDAGRIKRHETTRPDKVEDRARLALAAGAHTGPVFLAYRGRQEVDRLVAAAMATAPPLYEFTAADGVAHEIWRVAGAAGDALAEAFAAVPELYVADGHHRAAAASRVESDRRADPSGPGDADLFLAALFPADQLRILPYNRVVADLAGLAADAFVAQLGEVLAVDGSSAPSPAERGRFSMYLGGRWLGLSAPRERLTAPDPVASLDAAILQDLVLGPLLGIDDPRTSDRIEFVGGIRGPEELVRRVDQRPGSVAFSLYPVTIDQLMAVADAGRELPPKSTWFEPKLRSGLLVHRF